MVPKRIIISMKISKNAVETAVANGRRYPTWLLTRKQNTDDGCVNSDCCNVICLPFRNVEYENKRTTITPYLKISTKFKFSYTDISGFLSPQRHSDWGLRLVTIQS
jgi:hypothetical protein